MFPHIIQFSYNNKLQKIIEIISEEFYQIDEETITKIDTYILRDILQSNKLKIVNEDWLLDKLIERQQFIKEKRKEIGNEKEIYSDEFFFEEVRFEFLSSESIQKFIEYLRYDEIDEKLWVEIKKRLILPVINENINERVIQETLKSTKFSYSCSYQQGNEFEGIFKYLTNITNGNIQNNKTIEITCSSLCCGDISNIVNFNDLNGNAHLSTDPSPRWIKIDFKTRQIQMTSYVINTGHYSSGVNNRSLKSWKVEISNDDSNWEVVDERNDVSEIKENNKIKQFEIQPTKPFRFIRIITDKDNHCDNYGFAIGNLEIYGGILEA